MTVTVEGLKAYLAIEHDEDDALIEGAIDAASAWIVGYCGLEALPSPLPSDLTQAVQQLAAHLYAHRGDGPEAVPMPAIVRGLVAPYYVWAF